MLYFATRISENLFETPEGFLLCRNVSIARTGEMIYAEGETPLKAKDGKVIITRTPEEVFSKETMASFEGKPFTIKHPKEFVNAKNWRELSNGHLQNVRRGEGDQDQDLVSDILITTSDAISLVKGGMREVSCGYEAEYVQTEDGRGEQKAIVGNHLALVDEGRAGPAYAINDHKGDHSMKTKFQELKERLLGLAKTIDEASGEGDPKPKEESGDEGAMYDELTKMVSDLLAKVENMKPKAKDEEVSSALEERLKKLEEAVAKILEAESAESEALAGDEGEEGEEEEAGDEGGEGDPELVGDTGDEAARAEILAPGIQITKDVKAKALKKCYETADGKAVIDSICGGKKPKFDNAEAVEMLFMAASELLKDKRSDELASAKIKGRAKDAFAVATTGKMTAEKMNEMNAKAYGRK